MGYVHYGLRNRCIMWAISGRRYNILSRLQPPPLPLPPPPPLPPPYSMPPSHPMPITSVYQLSPISHDWRYREVLTEAFPSHQGQKMIIFWSDWVLERGVIFWGISLYIYGPLIRCPLLFHSTARLKLRMFEYNKPFIHFNVNGRLKSVNFPFVPNSTGDMHLQFISPI